MLVEHEYRYPRRFTLISELVCGLAVGWTALNLIRAVVALLWLRWPVEPYILNRVSLLRSFATWVEETGPQNPTFISLFPPLGWLLLALVLALVVRNAFPAVRFSMRGMLVSFADDWVSIQWEGVRALRVTDAADGVRFVVLVQTDGSQLTSWHRIYSFLYRFGFSRGFLITSSMRDAEGLLREIMNEIARRQKLGEKLNISMEEGGRSPLFGLLLNPPGLFRRPSAQSQTPIFQPVTTAATMGNAAALTMPSMGGMTAAPSHKTTTTPQPATVPSPLSQDVISARYSPLVQAALNGITVLIVGCALWRYVADWMLFLVFAFPSLQESALFRNMEVVPLVSHWGLLLGTHLRLVLVAGVVLLLRHLFPAVAVDSVGLVFTALGRSHRLPWEQVRVVKATDVRDEQHVVLVEAEGTSLPWYYRIGPWLYDGGVGRGVLIWPLLRPFEPLMQRMALELTRRQQPDEPLRLRDDAPGWLLMLVVRPADALDRLVMLDEHDDDMPHTVETSQMLRAGGQMLWNAGAPAVLLLVYWITYRGFIFSPQVPFMLLIALIWGMTEWPLASFMASSLDQVMGAGNKGYRGLYLYPTAQLPRLLPLALGILLTLIGFPGLALLAWAGGIAWSGLLTAGLWAALYGWRGMPLLASSTMTIFFQILTLLGVLVLRG